MPDTDALVKFTKYFTRLTGTVPSQLSSQDARYRYFTTTGETLTSRFFKLDLYALHTTRRKLSNTLPLTFSEKGRTGGFRPLVYTRADGKQVEPDICPHPYDSSHVTMVYAALCTLLTLGDDLSRVDRKGVLSGVASLQCKDVPGLFEASSICSERDLRFVYSAVATCYILNGLDAIDGEAIIGFIGRCWTYDGGFSWLPNLEAHAGAAYCAIATLFMLNRLDSFLPTHSRPRQRLVKWLVSLQSEGLHGRIRKDDDTCYTFWVCASLKLLHSEHFIDKRATLRFVARCWDPIIGGISKYPGAEFTPDPLHSYLALSGLSCLKPINLNDSELPGCETAADHEDADKRPFYHLISEHIAPIRPELNISEKTFEFLQQLHSDWRSGP